MENNKFGDEANLYNPQQKDGKVYYQNQEIQKGQALSQSIQEHFQESKVQLIQGQDEQQFQQNQGVQQVQQGYQNAYAQNLQYPIQPVYIMQQPYNPYNPFQQRQQFYMIPGNQLVQPQMMHYQQFRPSVRKKVKKQFFACQKCKIKRDSLGEGIQPVRGRIPRVSGWKSFFKDITCRPKPLAKIAENYPQQYCYDCHKAFNGPGDKNIIVVEKFGY